MVTAVLLALTAVLSLLVIGLRGGDAGGRAGRLVPVGLTLLLLVAAATATALGSTVSGRGHAVVVILALVAAAAGGSRVTTAVFEVIDSGAPDGSDSPGRPGSPDGSEPAAEHDLAVDGSLRSAGDILRGGLWIGVLERLAAFATLVARWPEGIAVVLAVKGLGRYPELRTGRRPGLAERFIIGTLVSVLWAGLCAYAAAGPALG